MTRTPALLLSCLLAVAAATAAAPLYTNAALVSFDVRTRTLVVRTNDGRETTMKLDDTVAGFAGLRPGDEVILAVHGEPGMPRVSRILRSVRNAPVPRLGPLSGRTSVVDATAGAGNRPPAALEAYATRIASVAQQAAYVDSLWANFVTACDATVRTRNDREWFALWEDGSVSADLSTGFCRDLYNQVLSRGESVKASMSAAEDAARAADLLPGNIRDVRRRYAMDWDGWARTSPERLTP